MKYIKIVFTLRKIEVNLKFALTNLKLLIGLPVENVHRYALNLQIKPGYKKLRCITIILPDGFVILHCHKSDHLSHKTMIDTDFENNSIV